MKVYSNATIYIILNTKDDEIYIGSTTKSIERRFLWHKCRSRMNDYKHMPLYKHMKKRGEKSFFIFPLKACSNMNKKEIEIIERKYIEKLKPKLNNNIPTRSDKERYLDKKK